jgi:protein O-mannosyl-transferase
MCFALMTFFIIVLGITTYQRNRVWTSEKTLWEDAIVKAPDSERAYSNLALYYDLTGQYNKSLGLYEASLSKQWTSRFSSSLTLANMARIYAAIQDYEKSLALYDQALSADPSNIQTMYDKALVLATTGKWNQAKETMDSLLSREKITWNDLNLMGFILLRQNAPEDALRYFRQANKLSPHNPKIYIHIGVALSIAGFYQKADWFLIQAAQMLNEDIVALICLMDNHIRSGNTERLRIDMDILFKQFSIYFIRDNLQLFSQNKLLIPVSIEAISSLIAKNLKHRADDFTQGQRN